MENGIVKFTEQFRNAKPINANYGKNYTAIYNFNLIKKVAFSFPILIIILLFALRKNKCKSKIAFYIIYILSFISNLLFYTYLLLVCNNDIGELAVLRINNIHIVLLIITFISIILELIFNRKGKHNEHN